MTRSIHVLLIEGYADWEPALALAAARQWGQRSVTTVGFEAGPITSSGGLRVLPETTLRDVDPRAVELLLIAGGDRWEAGEYPREEFEAKVRALLDAEVPIAAICGATGALARGGFFAARDHTSNDRGWLDHAAPDYRGRERYKDELAVRDRGLITASGSAPVEFAREILAELGVMTDAQRAAWFGLFKQGRFPDGVDPAVLFGG